MKLWTTRVSRMVLAVAVAAVIVPVAQAARQPGFSHLQDLTAMEARYQAQVNRLTSTAGFSHLQDLNAMEARYVAETNLLTSTPTFYPSHLKDLKVLEAQTQVSLRAAAGTQKGAHLANAFDWADMSIGTLGLALLLGGTWFAVHSRRRRDELAPRTS